MVEEAVNIVEKKFIASKIMEKKITHIFTLHYCAQVLALKDTPLSKSKSKIQSKVIYFAQNTDPEKKELKKTVSNVKCPLKRPIYTGVFTWSPFKTVVFKAYQYICDSNPSIASSLTLAWAEV